MLFNSKKQNSRDKNSPDKTGRGRMSRLRVLVGVGLMVLGAAFAQAGETVSPNESTAAKQAAAVQRADKQSTSEKIQQRLTYRYGNPTVERFALFVSTNSAVALYDETTRLIDSRHLNPTSYATRAYQGVNNLLHAVGNRAFLRANGLFLSRSQVDKFRRSLSKMASSAPVRTATDARNLMLRTMDLASRQLAVRPTVVAMEFVYGAAESLGKYSTFIPSVTGRQPSASLEDHVVGIGVEIKPHASGVLVVKPLRGGPAAKAGLQRGDVIVNVNGRDLAGQSLDYAVDLIGGPEGSPVLLVINRDGRRRSPLSLIRRRVEIHSVSDVRMIDATAGIGYIKLDKFAQTSSEEMDQALWDLHRQGMQSLVFDLRGNPGGLLTTAIELSNKFLPRGAIVSTRGRNAVDNTAEQATFERTWKIPLVVLIDGNSASASEIFAAAIQENDRGLVVGRRSYGKGTVQTHFPLQSVSGNLKLTTAKFYSPRGREIAGAGVDPDVKVDNSESDDFVVRLSDDRDIQAAMTIARGEQVQELASALSNFSGRSQPGRQLGS